MPLFLFAVLFGLSMDYHVFLLSRIRERFRRTGDNSDAIAHGVGSTGRIITGGALIIIAVFSGFARGDLVMFQQMGFGVAIALLLDATIVRLVLVPAAMQLLGRATGTCPPGCAGCQTSTSRARARDDARHDRRPAPRQGQPSLRPARDDLERHGRPPAAGDCAA